MRNVRKVYIIKTVIPYEGEIFHGVYSSPSTVASWLDDNDDWGESRFSTVVVVHVLDGALLDESYDEDGKVVPKAQFKPFSEMR